MLTTHEAADRLGMTARSVARLIRQGRIAGRAATPAEVAALYAAGRIRGIPPTGIVLIDDAAIAAYVAARKPAGRPRKPD